MTQISIDKDLTSNNSCQCPYVSNYAPIPPLTQQNWRDLPVFIHNVREHLVSDRTSLIFKHLHNSSQCHTLCSDECFSILDHASTTFQLKIKEVIHIQWEKPTLTHRPYHVNLLLLLFVLSNQHFVIHFELDSVLFKNQNLR